MLSGFDASGQAETLYEYDRAGNMTSQRVKTSHAGQPAAYSRVDFGYDAWGRLIEVTSYDGGVRGARNHRQVRLRLGR